MKARHVVSALSLFGLSILLSPTAFAGGHDESHILQAAQSATTRGDHEAIAKYYEDAAKTMQFKLQEKKRLLEHYQDKSYLYGRQAQDLQSHTEALTRQYEAAVKKSVEEAQAHHQMALDVKEKSVPAPQKLTAAQTHHNRFNAE